MKTTDRTRYASSLSLLKSLNEMNNKAAKRGSFITVLLVIIIIAGLMIGSIWQKVLFGQMAAEIETLRNQESELLGIIDRQRAEAFNLKNDSRIVNIATNQLDMIVNPPFEVLSPGEFEKKKYEELAAHLAKETNHKK